MRDFQKAIVRWMGCDPDLIDTPGVSVAGASDRAESRVSAGYRVGSHFYITCDPAVEALLSSATADMEPSLDAWVATGHELGGELLGSSLMHVPGASGLASAAQPADEYEVRALDLEVDRLLVERFVAGNSEDDLDQAEVELDNLDELVEITTGADAEIASWSSCRPFDMAEAFGDIGVLTHPDHRHRGLGRATVSAICTRMADAGLSPLYRCDVINTGSAALAVSLGFELATHLTAFRFDVN